ncbi:MAG: membrane protein insertase YidC [Myxococcales bacterium]|nr:membrane protein insertase YidC [Myxococcales bacterium]
MSSTVRVVLTVVICTALLIVWQFFFAKKAQPPPAGSGTGSAARRARAGTGGKAGTGAGRTAGTAKRAEAPSSQPASQPTRDPKLGPVTYSVEGQQFTVDLAHARATFSNRNGTLRHWVLKDPKYTEKRGGKVVPIDLVQTPARKGPWQLVTTFPESDFSLPDNARFELVSKSRTQIVYRWSSSKVEVTKTFKLDNKSAQGAFEISVKNKTDRGLGARLRVALHSYQDPSTGKTGFANPYPRLATGLCHVNGELQRRNAQAIRGTQSSCSAAGCGMGEGEVRAVGKVEWIGTDDRYFLTALVPKGDDRDRKCAVALLSGRSVVEVSVLFAERKIPPGKSLSKRFTLYIGAKKVGALDAVKTVGDTEARLADSIEFGSWLQFLARPMLALLKFFYNLVGNWGLAIILLTLIVKGLTLYPTHRSMQSMKTMQKLKPKIDEIREKYKNDKQRLNQEMMSLYKVHKVNPFGGCLPMVIQMPIWFALYRTLGNTVELYHSPFFGWITDLTAPDPYYILPILMGASMFAQQIITPNPSMSGGQAKLMKYFLPGMFTVMMLWLPAGLTLYIFVNTLLTFAHQLYMNKKDDAPATGPRGGVSGRAGGSSGGSGGDGGKAKTSADFKPKLSSSSSSSAKSASKPSSSSSGDDDDGNGRKKTTTSSSSSTRGRKRKRKR